MYKVAVPVVNENVTRCTPLRAYDVLKGFDADRVFLALGNYEADSDKRKQSFCELRKNCAFFKEKGLEVGVWIWAFMLPEGKYTCMKGLKGQSFRDNMCPLDEDFLQFAEAYVTEMAQSGVDLIMYDDDFRYGFLGASPACVCEHHLKKISELLGEEVTAETVRHYVYNGGKNKYRDAYLKANGDALRNFAKRMRSAADRVNPRVRMGACACLNSWDIDGVSAEEIARIFAGDTKPFFRLIGAPYWAALHCWGNSLQDCIELSRMECAWTVDKDIEIFSEGDVYPRPRTLVPASYLEGFDTALRAAGCTDGILKYGMDYTSVPEYEMGYVRSHKRNRELYKELEEIFSSAVAVGVRVYETPAKLADAVFEEEENIDNMFFSLCSRVLAYNTVPTVFEGRGVTGAAFGENARHLDKGAFERGLILDIKAARILSDMGTDVGICRFGEKISAGSTELFCDNENRIPTYGAEIYDIGPSENAEVLSYTEKDGRKIPVTYRYVNSDGQRFFVINVVTGVHNPDILRHYERNRQLTEAVRWLSGESLPAAVNGHPALYMMCKKKGSCLAVGLWNFFADTVYEPEIELDGEYCSVSFINCTGEITGNKVRLSHIPAFGFAGFCVE